MGIANRIKKIAACVPHGARVADIGTDHGYLAQILLEENAPEIVLACDVNPGPLEYAKRTLAPYLSEERVEIRLGNGLQALRQEDAIDTLVIAGMGGRLMLNILEGNPAVLSGVRNLILSPNIAWDKVRQDLSQKGWRIVREDLVMEEGKFYPIMVWEKGEMAKLLSPAECFAGPLLLGEKHPLLPGFLAAEEKKHLRNLKNMKSGSRPGLDQVIKEKEALWKQLKED